MRSKSRLRPVLIEVGAQTIKTPIVAPENGEPAQISLKVRDQGWAPYRVRFDASQAAWIVSTFDWSNGPRGI